MEYFHIVIIATPEMYVFILGPHAFFKLTTKCHVICTLDVTQCRFLGDICISIVQSSYAKLLLLKND